MQRIDPLVSFIPWLLEIACPANVDGTLQDSKDQNDVSDIARSSPNDHEDLHHGLEDPASGLTNPLSTGPPAFMSAENGRTCTSVPRRGNLGQSNGAR